jgi:hypothetical protein
MKQMIFERTLADYTNKLIEALNSGYRVSETMEDYPLFVNNGFYVGLVKDEVILAEVEDTETETTETEIVDDQTTETQEDSQSDSAPENTTETNTEDTKTVQRRGRRASINI